MEATSGPMSSSEDASSASSSGAAPPPLPPAYSVSSSAASSLSSALTSSRSSPASSSLRPASTAPLSHPSRPPAASSVAAPSSSSSAPAARPPRAAPPLNRRANSEGAGVPREKRPWCQLAESPAPSSVPASSQRSAAACAAASAGVSTRRLSASIHVAPEAPALTRHVHTHRRSDEGAPGQPEKRERMGLGGTPAEKSRANPRASDGLSAGTESLPQDAQPRLKAEGASERRTTPSAFFRHLGSATDSKQNGASAKEGDAPPGRERLAKGPVAAEASHGESPEDHVLKALKNKFGYTAFRAGQEQAVRAVLEGNDALVVMPTGGGKTLTYLLPGLLLPGLVIVVSPLLALMDDQVRRLRERGLPALAFNSLLSARLRATILEELPRHVFPSYAGDALPSEHAPPSSLGGGATAAAGTADAGVALVAVDEAHCISTWGHDFRKSYRNLSVLRTILPHTPLLACTATATPAVCADIQSSLELRNPVRVGLSFDRKNIFYEVRLKSHLDSNPGEEAWQGKGQEDPGGAAEDEEEWALADMASEVATRHKGECGIIYCFKKSTCDDVAVALRCKGISARAYHAGLSDSVRCDLQRSWMKGETLVLVATVAFGLGVDNPNVRFVIHHSLPKTMEGYYQESGRCGRDGLPAHALLYYSRRNYDSLRYIMDYTFSQVKLYSKGGKREDGGARAKRHEGGGQADAPAAAGGSGSAQEDAKARLESLERRYRKEIASLKAVRAYCEEAVCRRACILKFFGETLSLHAGAAWRRLPSSGAANADGQQGSRKRSRAAGERATSSDQPHAKREKNESSHTGDLETPRADTDMDSHEKGIAERGDASFPSHVGKRARCSASSEGGRDEALPCCDLCERREKADAGGACASWQTPTSFSASSRRLASLAARGRTRVTSRRPSWSFQGGGMAAAVDEDAGGALALGTLEFERNDSSDGDGSPTACGRSARASVRSVRPLARDSAASAMTRDRKSTAGATGGGGAARRGRVVYHTAAVRRARPLGAASKSERVSEAVRAKGLRAVMQELERQEELAEEAEAKAGKPSRSAFLRERLAADTRPAAAPLGAVPRGSLQHRAPSFVKASALSQSRSANVPAGGLAAPRLQSGLARPRGTVSFGAATASAVNSGVCPHDCSQRRESSTLSRLQTCCASLVPTRFRAPGRSKCHWLPTSLCKPQPPRPAWYGFPPFFFAGDSAPSGEDDAYLAVATPPQTGVASAQSSSPESDCAADASVSAVHRAPLGRLLGSQNSDDAFKPIRAGSSYTYARESETNAPYRVRTSLSTLVALAPPSIPPPFITPSMPAHSNRASPPPSGPAPDAAGALPRSDSSSSSPREPQHRHQSASGYPSQSSVSSPSDPRQPHQSWASGSALPGQQSGSLPHDCVGAGRKRGKLRAVVLILIGVCIGLAVWPMFVSFLTFRLLHSFHEGDSTDLDATDFDGGAEDDGARPPDGSFGSHMRNNTTDTSAGAPNAASDAAIVPRPPTFPPLSFNDLAGLTEAKTELQEVVQFLRDPSKFERLGARLPKGVLLVGPPGTGKTALARAVATEAGVPYFYASGSEFVEIYVGQGARRVRGLFSYARSHSPCIIFLDELDAVGGRRQASAGPGAGNREHDQTLNQLLVEMDGFNQTNRIIVLAATNRVDTLDPALLRPGRFDRVVYVSLPDVAARELILQKYLQRVPVVPPEETLDGQALKSSSGGLNQGDSKQKDGTGEVETTAATSSLPRPRPPVDQRNELEKPGADEPQQGNKNRAPPPQTSRDQAALRRERERVFHSERTAGPAKESGQWYEVPEKKQPILTQVHKDLAKHMAKITPGFSGAELENLVNEAALLAARANKEIVTLQELQEARDKVTMGPARKTRVMSPYQRQLTAYHEAGHAIIAFYLQPYADPIHKATIVSRGSALGFVEQVPLEDRYGHGMAQLEARLCVCMGGRVAERLVFGRDALSNGASSDIETATRMAYVMVTEWGMSEKLGPLSYKVHGRSRRAFISSETASVVEEEVKQLVTTAERKAEKLLRKHRKQLREVALQLLEKETLSGEEISDILDPSGSYRKKVEKLRIRMQQGEQPSFLQRLIVQLKRGFQWLILPRDQSEFAASVEADKRQEAQEEAEEGKSQSASAGKPKDEDDNEPDAGRPQAPAPPRKREESENKDAKQSEDRNAKYQSAGAPFAPADSAFMRSDAALKEGKPSAYKWHGAQMPAEKTLRRRI
ncbi:hypothetical protein BESB_002860 [Besnoitia besnoiti]|uniref:ATP-dependent DNA helicase, RecQ family protein n=1 Tax=Besnoitia besnoiti TaxID=94643 RepID=A0A2A9MIZ2_BESBE|nr:hypothetical protein BESB_002860 [Besnoitia besnoiti]PFH37945.1 hypothetical protein BESB_002860 [Besnoitia besnoiti]